MRHRVVYIGHNAFGTVFPIPVDSEGRVLLTALGLSRFLCNHWRPHPLG